MTVILRPYDTLSVGGESAKEQYVLGDIFLYPSIEEVQISPSAFDRQAPPWRSRQPRSAQEPCGLDLVVERGARASGHRHGPRRGLLARAELARGRRGAAGSGTGMF